MTKLITPTILTLAALALPATAVAQGGKTPPAPAPSAPPVTCDYSQDGTLPDGRVLFSNQVGQAGCLQAVVTGSVVRVFAVQLTPGWSSSTQNTSDGVRVTFAGPAGAKADARIEPGKTDIRA